MIELSCVERKRRFVKCSVNELLYDILLFFDDCMVYFYICFDYVRIFWLYVVFFFYDVNGNSNKSGEYILNVKGIFCDVVIRVIGVCCKIFVGKILEICFFEKVLNLMDLCCKFFYYWVDMIIFVYNDEEKYGGNVLYIKILDFFGVIFIVFYFFIVKKWNLVFNVVFGIWFVVLMVFLMLFVVGVLIWVLVSRWKIIDFLCKCS